MLPDGWKETTLEKYIHVKHGYAFKGEYFSNSGKYIVLTPGNFFETGGFREQKDKIKYYSGEIPKEYILKKGDCILAMTEQGAGLLGSAAFIPNDDKFLHNQRIGLIEITDPNSVSSDFLYWLYNDPKNRLIISNEAGGTKVKHTSPKKLVDISILLPPLPEQKKIAAILSTWDRAIEGTEKLLANSQQQKKALMQQLLTGKKRLPGFTGEWRVCSLSDVATVQTATSKTQYICENGARFIVDMGSVNRLGNLVCTKSTQYNEDLLPKGTLVMPKDDIGGGNIIGRTSYIDRDDLYVLGDHVYALNINNCDSKFLHFLINSNPINKNLRRMANGTAQLGLGKKDVLKQKIKIPSQLSEQKVIATVLTTADEEITAVESDLSRLRQEKKALMQQLLTGKRRVTVD